MSTSGQIRLPHYQNSQASLNFIVTQPTFCIMERCKLVAVVDKCLMGPYSTI